MNLYRGCALDCAYCDGRAEKCQVTGELLDEALARVAAVGADFVMFGGMTLKAGRQQEHFMPGRSPS
jgi:hypothetical protein